MELTITEFSGEVQKKIFERLNTEYLSTGKYVKDQMSVSPNVMSMLMVSTAGMGISTSASMSSSLFMATAPVSSLMRYSTGAFGSIVVDSGGKIVEHAGFIPAGGTMMSVAAPMMVTQTFSSVAILQKLSAMDKKLDVIKESIDKLLARQEVTKVAELLAAVHIIDEIYSQYGKTGCFSTDMIIRLALAERDAIILSRRYEMLEDADDGGFANYTTYCTMLASFLILRVKYLRTCVDIQENPQFVQQSSENFSLLLKYNIKLWDKLLRKSEKMKSDIEEISTQIESSKGLQRIVQLSKEKELSRKKDEYAAAMEKERIILKDFLALIDTAKQISETSNTQGIPTLMYWRDHEGDHCFTSNGHISDILSSVNAH